MALRVLGGVAIVGALATGAWLGWQCVEWRPGIWGQTAKVGGPLPEPPPEPPREMARAPADPAALEPGATPDEAPAAAPEEVLPAGEGDAAPAPAPAPVPAPVTYDVDAMVAADRYPVAGWPEGRRFGGAITHVAVAGPVPARLGARPLRAEDVLVVSGWAGDPSVGLRFSHVVLSLCAQVVGRAEVGAASPGLGRFMHPNLGRAGFDAFLPVALLPTCPEPVLRAWAVRSGAERHALAGERPLPGLPPASDSEAARFAGRTAAPLRPSDLPERAVQRIDVRVRSAYLRRCGGRACAPVGGLDAGRHRVVIADRDDGWSLLLGDTQEGWIRDTLYRVVEVAPRGVNAAEGRRPRSAKPAGRR